MATANRKVLSQIAEAQELVDQVRRFIKVGPERTITSEQIEALVAAHERSALVEDEQRRRLGIGFQKGYRLEKPNGHGMSEEDRGISLKRLELEMRTINYVKLNLTFVRGG